MDLREQRGMELAATRTISQKAGLWIVPSQAGSGTYVSKSPRYTHRVKSGPPALEERRLDLWRRWDKKLPITP